jgi:subtilisin family serine protease
MSCIQVYYVINFIPIFQVVPLRNFFILAFLAMAPSLSYSNQSSNSKHTNLFQQLPKPQTLNLHEIDYPQERDLFSEQWNLSGEPVRDFWGNVVKKPHHIAVKSVWEAGHTGSSSMIVAIIDSGIDIHHPDLIDNIYTNTAEIPGNGIDDDHNGYADDVHGWNFLKNTGEITDTVGHGTHIAGVIGANGHNDFGIRGINWDISLMPLVYLDDANNGNNENAVKAIEYAVKMGAKIINISWGGSISYKIHDAIAMAGEHGVLVITSSGNDGENLDVFPYFPASHHLDNMIVVGSSAFRGEILGDSNWGKKTVDILAPGYQVLSTLPGGKYGTMSGTSMAAPHVVGVAALLWSAFPEWTVAQVKAALIESSEFDPVLANLIGWGQLNAAQSFQGIKNQKVIPSASNLQRKNHQQRLVFNASASLQKFSVKTPEAQVLRLHFKELKLREGVERVMMRDEHNQLIQIIAKSQQGFYSDFCYGEQVFLELVSSESKEFFVELDHIEFVARNQ